MQEILVDKEGYKQFFCELERLKELSLTSASVGSEAYKDAIGDGWHDNFAFEDSIRESRAIASKIDTMLNEQPYLKIVDDADFGEKYINIGDTIKVLVKYDTDDIEEYTLKLTGKYLPDYDANIQEISLNSPLGKTLYLKKSDDELYYDVNGKIVKIEVLELCKNNNLAK